MVTGWPSPRSSSTPSVGLDDQAARLYAGILEIEDADEDILDLLGDMVGERRVGGMSSTLYRRLIAGRRVARAGGVTRARLYAGWRALTGSDAATMDEPGSGTVRLVAAVDYTPTDLWLTRAGSIVRDLVGAGYEASAMVVTPTSARFASPTSPWGVGRWAYQLRVNGAP